MTLRRKNGPVSSTAAALVACLFVARLAVASDPTPPASANSELERPPSSEVTSAKAAFLLDLVKFVRWPSKAFRSKSAPYSICVVGDDGFEKVLVGAGSGRKVGRRVLEIKGFPDATDAAKLRECHVVFLGKSQTTRSNEILAALRGVPVLTTADWKEFSTTGGMVGLFVDGQTFAFEVDAAAADAANLKISSQLLKVAKAVHWAAAR